mgnify:CR=1 FL=1
MDTRKLSTLLMAGALAAMLSGCGGADAKKDPAARAPSAALLAARDVAKVARADLATGVPVSGTLQPAVDVNITAPFPEALEGVLVKEGQAVRQGQPLARFRTESLAPAATSADAQRRIAAAEHERMKNLFAEGAVSQRDVDNAEAALRSAEATAAFARKQLDEATVRAPFAGVIAHRAVQSGDRVADGDPLFRLVNTAELEFEATVPGEVVGRVRPGAPVTLAVSGLGDVRIEGRVARVNATADAATRQVKVYVVVPNRDGRLVGDLFATGRIEFQQVPRALALPAAGVRVAPDGRRFVWVVADGKAQQRAVTVGLRDEQQDLVEITGGLAEGDTAIVGPVEGLTAGQPVQIGGDPGAGGES